MLILGTMPFSVPGQSSTATRPRVAATSTPPPLANDPYRGSAPTAPVLRNGSRPAAGTTSPTPPEGDDEIIRVETNLVTMPVAVLDRDGRFISGLGQKDFKIFENGVEQKIDYFQSVEQPFTVVLLLDVSPSTQFKIDEIQHAAISFINQLRPADRVMVVSFDDSIHVLSPITNNRNAIRNAILQTQFGDGTSLYEAVDYVIERELRHIQGRKAVVLFTDGVDTTSRRATYESTLRMAEEVDALFYPIRFDTSFDMGVGRGYPQGRGPGPAGSRRVSMADILDAIISGRTINMGRGGGRSGGSAAEYETGKRYLQQLAINSGGRGFEAQTMYNLDTAFSGIAEELRRQYSLGYYPETVGQIGDRKQIKIRVMRPDVVVRAKTSYIVGQGDRTLSGR